MSCHYFESVKEKSKLIIISFNFNFKYSLSLDLYINSVDPYLDILNFNLKLFQQLDIFDLTFYNNRMSMANGHAKLSSQFLN